jgi:hypothetical protein
MATDKDNELFPEFEETVFYKSWLAAVLTGGLSEEQITSSLKLARQIYDRVANRVLDRDIEF